MSGEWYTVTNGSLQLNTYGLDLDASRLTTVFIHELGHFAGLRDLNNPEYGPKMGIEYYHWLMYGINTQLTQSSFNSSEVAAINAKADSDNIAPESSSSIFNEVGSEDLNVTLVEVDYIDNDLESVIEHSSHAVVGTVTSIGQAQKGEHVVYRIATVDVSDDLIGNAPLTVNVKILGGTYDGMQYIYTGSPDWNV